MPLSRRYSPEFSPGESSIIGLDFSAVIPVGVGIQSGTLDIFSNVAVPVDVKHDFKLGEVTVRGRTLYAQIAGGVAGQDYQMRWTAVDTSGNKWPRVALLLCALTS